MKIERQKIDALSDAVEIPDGATHYAETPMEYIFLRIEYGGWQCYAFGEWHSFDPDGSDINPL